MISTPSKVSIAVVERLLSVLSEMGVHVPGVIANMVRGDASAVREMSARCGVPFAGEVPWEPEIERAAGSAVRLAATGAAAALLKALAAMGYR